MIQRRTQRRQQSLGRTAVRMLIFVLLVMLATYVIEYSGEMRHESYISACLVAYPNLNQQQCEALWNGH